MPLVATDHSVRECHTVTEEASYKSLTLLTGCCSMLSSLCTSFLAQSWQANSFARSTSPGLLLSSAASCNLRRKLSIDNTGCRTMRNAHQCTASATKKETLGVFLACSSANLGKLPAEFHPPSRPGQVYAPTKTADRVVGAI